MTLFQLKPFFGAASRPLLEKGKDGIDVASGRGREEAGGRGGFQILQGTRHLCWLGRSVIMFFLMLSPRLPVRYPAIPAY